MIETRAARPPKKNTTPSLHFMEYEVCALGRAALILCGNYSSSQRAPRFQNYIIGKIFFKREEKKVYETRLINNNNTKNLIQSIINHVK